MWLRRINANVTENNREGTVIELLQHAASRKQFYALRVDASTGGPFEEGGILLAEIDVTGVRVRPILRLSLRLCQRTVSGLINKEEAISEFL